MELKKDEEGKKDESEETETEGTEFTDTTQDKKDERRFTQADVDEIVKKRLDKEKRSHKQEVDSLGGEKKSLQDELNKIDESFASEVEELSKGIDPDVLELMDGLSNREKVAKLKKLQGKMGKFELKETKKGSGEDTPNFTRRNSV